MRRWHRRLIGLVVLSSLAAVTSCRAAEPEASLPAEQVPLFADSGIVLPPGMTSITDLADAFSSFSGPLQYHRRDQDGETFSEVRYDGTAEGWSRRTGDKVTWFNRLTNNAFYMAVEVEGSYDPQVRPGNGNWYLLNSREEAAPLYLTSVTLLREIGDFAVGEASLTEMSGGYRLLHELPGPGGGVNRTDVRFVVDADRVLTTISVTYDFSAEGVSRTEWSFAYPEHLDPVADPPAPLPLSQMPTFPVPTAPDSGS